MPARLPPVLWSALREMKIREELERNPAICDPRCVKLIRLVESSPAASL